MSKKPKEYQKLSGSARAQNASFIAGSRIYCRLWQGSDHLLMTERSGYTETYKRFYYRDIQAIVIRRTKNATIMNIVFLFLICLWLSIVIFVSVLGVKITFGAIAGFFILLLLANLWAGPSCVTQLKTAVQAEYLAPWNTLKRARKGLEKLRPLITQAQGELTANGPQAPLSFAPPPTSDFPPNASI